MRKVLIAGGAGFVGSHLADAFLTAGNEVIVVDNMSTGRSENIKHLDGRNSFRYINDDIREPLDLDVDLIFNMACPASPPKYQVDPVATMDICYIGTKNLLNLAHKNSAKLIHASTSEVYGDPQIKLQSEQYRGWVNTMGPRACYDEGKRISETLCYEYNEMYGLDVRVARIFNTYGPRMDPDDGRVVSNFIMQALRGENLTIYGDGSQTRSFGYISDLIDGLQKIATQIPISVSPINLGNTKEFSIIELADLVLKMLPSLNSKLVFEKLPQDDPQQRCPDTQRAKTVLNWEAKVDLESGLAKTIEYFRGYTQ